MPIGRKKTAVDPEIDDPRVVRLNYAIYRDVVSSLKHTSEFNLKILDRYVSKYMSDSIWEQKNSLKEFEEPGIVDTMMT